VKGNAKNGTRQRSNFTLAVRSVLGGLWFSFWFFIAFPGGLLHLSGVDLIPPPGASRLIGYALIVVAYFVFGYQIVRFIKQGEGTPLPFDPPQKLVAKGIYGRVRNPMYATYVVITLGEAILYRSLALLVYTAGFALLIHIYVVLVEERTLRERFGAPYERYCETSGRWLPRR
jgi:protein-S-isoprenylcysteine O-methyltransferase Ste14